MPINGTNLKRYEIVGRFDEYTAKICAKSYELHHGVKPRAVVVCSGVTKLTSVTFQVGNTGHVDSVKIIVNDDVFLRPGIVALDED